MEDHLNQSRKPTLALAMGDPAGISPELTAKVVMLDEVRDAARLIVIGDRRVFDAGARVAGVRAELDVVHDGDPLPVGDRVAFVDLAHTEPGTIELGIASAAGGRSGTDVDSSTAASGPAGPASSCGAALAASAPRC